jgi:uncharacterized BrkB/YihY/UPF0761 family membrane protein
MDPIILYIFYRSIKNFETSNLLIILNFLAYLIVFILMNSLNSIHHHHQQHHYMKNYFLSLNNIMLMLLLHLNTTSLNWRNKYFLNYEDQILILVYNLEVKLFNLLLLLIQFTKFIRLVNSIKQFKLAYWPLSF